MTKNIFTFLFFLLSFSLGAQTNYPPNTAPWTNHPANWVYDCSFQGYNNFNPTAPYLPCGYYDELVLTNLPFGGTPLNPHALTIYFDGVSFLSVGARAITEVQLTVSNEVPGSVYTLYYSTNLLSVRRTFSTTYTSTGQSDNLTVSYLAPPGVWPPSLFFQVYGQTYFEPLTHGNLSFFFRATCKTRPPI
jgi:hypothetical protein